MTLPALTTRRLEFTPVTQENVDVAWAVWRDPDVRRYLFDDVPVTRERVEDILRDVVAGHAEGLGVWTARLRGADSVVGTAGLLRVTTSVAYDPTLAGAVELLAAFEPAVWGHGYATEALEGVVDYAFGVVGLSRVTAVVDVPNEASHRLIQRLGFTPTGESPGPRYRFRTYVLTPDRFAVRSSSMMKPSTGALVRQLEESLEPRSEVLEAYLFGSIARGTDEPRSDVDIAVYLVEPRPAETPFGYTAELAATLMTRLGAPRVDVVVLNDAPPLLYHRVLRDGIRIVSRDRRATTTREGYALSRYCDYAIQLAKIDAVQAARIEAGNFGR